MRDQPLKVPRYQRPYTWGDREVRQLIQDLRSAYDRKAPFYFIGTIVLVKNKGRLEISDGQQRLSTLTMLLAYVRDRLPGRAKAFQSLIMNGDKPRLMMRENDANFFLGFVQEPGKMAELAAQTEFGSDSKEAIAAAAQTVADYFSEMDDRELDAFISYVLRCCTLNVVDADERGCAQAVFSALNMRGSPLSGADIIKSDLIENANLPDADADTAARKWEQTEEMFQREDFAALLEMMPFLLTGERLLSPGDLAAFRAAVDRAGGVHKFLFEHLPRYAQVLRSIFACNVDVGPASEEVNRRIQLMKQVEKWNWAPAAIAFLLNHSGQHERARRFFRALDCFSFACEFSVIDTRSQEGRYRRAMLGVADDKKLYGERGALELTKREYDLLVAHMNHMRRRDRQRRLLLIRIEAALKSGHLIDMTDDASVEHILPKGGGPAWNTLFPDPQRRLKVANMIGNLTLITHEQQKLADNRSYADKRKVFFETPGAPLHMLTENISPVPEWTEQVIEKRTYFLIQELFNDWGLYQW
ncbi:MAG TPA: DUF262 domain-containing HNH endonuclease family protein [Terricaulis sp.]|nr:DUF262 domain-containing HNH endonuclease family protein [Terricaulis sp.]HRP10189.1 DUF262 domain-containing HNH endonuclease family protein [Terricaulis sp.]